MQSDQRTDTRGKASAQNRRRLVAVLSCAFAAVLMICGVVIVAGFLLNA